MTEQNRYPGRCGCGAYVRVRKGYLGRTRGGIPVLRCNLCQVAHDAEQAKAWRSPRLPYKDD